MILKEIVNGHPIILPDIEYFPSEFIEIMGKDGSYIDGLITYNNKSNHSFGVNLDQLKQNNYHTTTSNIEGYLVN